MATVKTAAARKTPAKKKTVVKKATNGKAAPGKQPDASAKKKATNGAPVAGGNPAGLRVRMYRIGFGDFFLVTVPSPSGPKHILIDCGVHAKDTHSIAAAVAHMAQETNKQLALIIVTHRHADHVTGFSKCKDVFQQFKVEHIWMSWYENPTDTKALALQTNIAAVTNELRFALAARNDPASAEYKNMVENITDVMPASGGQQNPGAFEVLRNFPGKPPIDYYKAGDKPTLPPSLIAAGLQAEILGPPDDPNVISKTDKASQEYIASVGAIQSGPVKPFTTAFRVQPQDYESDLFKLVPRSEIEARLAAVQPDVLAAKAAMANNMINNQSLVTLLTFKGKTLLFAGDAQWGNWANFLFGGVTETTMKPESEAILAKLDFYKVGHHGSTNATPKDALAAMRKGCVAMCSTAIGAYNEVPRDALVTAIDQRTNNQLARSDQVAAGNAKADPKAGNMPTGVFKANTVGECGYIDYML
jgi:beta-lactamase superfamily II metal-dependent hydrolase